MKRTAHKFDPIPLDIEEALANNPDVKAEYDRLEPEFELLNTLLKARKRQACPTGCCKCDGC